MADNKSKSSKDSPSGAGAPEPSLGRLITETRERKGMTREQIAADTHLPAHYIKMIETDNYDLISDRLYLVPFLRRYAAFLGLDAEEIASRFVSDVQHAEANVVRISQEITVVSKRSPVSSRIAFAVLIAVLLALLADLAWRRFLERQAPAPAPIASPVAMVPAPRDAQAPNAPLPPAIIVANPNGAAPPPSAAASNVSRAASVPPAADRSDRSPPLPRAAAGG